jgi:hypothetical protein
MNSEDLMFILEAVAYISASMAAIVYIWETCILSKIKSIKKRQDSTDYNDLNVQEQRRLSSPSNSMYDDAFRD